MTGDGSDDGTVDPALLHEALEIINGSRPVIAEPALLARQRFNQATQLARDGRHDAAMLIFRQLAAAPDQVPPDQVPPDIGLAATTAWATDAFAHHSWPEVIEAEQAGGHHLDALRRQAGRQFSQDAAAAERGRLAAMAAFAAAKAGSPETAVAILERGRTTMLAERFRRQPRPAATSTPGNPRVTYLVATSAGGLALDSGGPQAARAVWLERLGAPVFRDRVSSYFSALDGVRRNGALGMSAWQSEVAAMVAVLRDALAPLFPGPPDGPVALIPVGFLSVLPVAAAVLGSAIPDRAVTILPSLGLDPGPMPAQPADRVLSIADPSLPSARWEDTCVRGFFSTAVSTAAATAADVLAAVPAGGVVHLSCHAEVDIGAPLRSAVILPGGVRLTVDDILHARWSPPAVVVLSACESGVPGPYLLDEAISLPAVFLAAGCQSVVGTLWPVEDLSAALIMLRFYYLWRHEHVPAPVALARAQHWLRTTSDRDKCRFIETDLVAAAACGQAEATALADHLRARSPSPAGNCHADPYYWAGFYFTGRAG